MKKHSKNFGFTLIELMISMTIGAFILIGVIQVSMSSKRTYLISDYSSRLQEDLRGVTYDFNRIVRIAGYKSSSWKSNTSSFRSNKIFKENGQFIVGFDGKNNSDSDSLSLRFQGSGDEMGNPDGDVVDCIGDAVDAGDFATVTLDIKEGGVLRCTSVNETSGKDQVVEFVENVQNMQLNYGIDTDNDFYIDEYITATQVSDRELWGNVTSVRLAILLKSDKEIMDFKQKKSFALNDLTILPTGEDSYMRMQSTTTITIRNTVL